MDRDFIISVLASAKDSYEPRSGDIGWDEFAAKIDEQIEAVRTPARVVTLVIRNPDYENEYVTEITGEVEVETIDVDLGSSFNGPKDFDADADWGKEWIARRREEVAHLPEDGPVRQAVEELIGQLTEEDD